MSGVINGTIGVQINNSGWTALGRFHVEVEDLDVTTISPPTKPDPAWEFVDAAGHFHAWDDMGKLPTLMSKEITVQPESDEDVEDDGDADEDEWEDENPAWSYTVQACMICGEQVTPGRIPDSKPDRVLGRMSWSVEVEHRLPVGERVVVRVHSGTRTAFGVGIVTSARGVRLRERDPLTSGWSTITGAGPLGWRKVVGV